MIRDGLLLWTGLFILKNGCRVSLKPSLWGKLSTALLMIGITFLCFQQIIAWHIIEFNTFFWILCALFNISSGLHYFIRGGLMLLKRA
jgi:phosphatidylglycerophosphate synthase